MAVFVLILICAASFMLMFWASRTDAPITDELAHIPAGYSYVHNLDYRLNPEHPPLVKALAMLPVLFLQPNFPTGSDAWQNGLNAQWDMGAQFLYQSGNDANAIVATARIMPMLITILVVILTYLLASSIMGMWWALLPAFMFAMDPTVIAHGHYVTTDMGAALGVMLATYYFLKFVKSPSHRHLLYAGLAFGTAQAMKFSTPLLAPLFIFLAIVLWLRNMAFEWNAVERTQRFKIFLRRLGRHAWHIILIFAIGYVVIVYPIYFLFTSHYPIAKQVSDTQTILTSFAGGPGPAGSLCHGMRCLADLDIGMAKSPVLRPFAEYLLGILMVIQRSDGGNTIYFLGQVRWSGGWIYFPALFLLKEPIPTLIIVLLGLLCAAWWIFRKAEAVRWRIKPAILEYLRTNFTEFSMASFIVLYWGYSMRSPLNIGIRHLMPTIPFIYILAAGIWKKWIAQINFNGLAVANTIIDAFVAMGKQLAHSFIIPALKYVFLVLLLFWLLLETLFAAPHFLSYFNEFGGGVNGGYRYVTDSNYDWGQDLLRLQTWVSDYDNQCALVETTLPCGIDKIAVDYFGGGNPHYSLGEKEVDWNSAKGNPADQGIHWLAISINQLQGATEPLAPGQTRNASDAYSWLTTLRPPEPGMGNAPKPDYRAGTSIFIYHL